MSVAKISEKIKQKIEEIEKDPKKQQMLFDILECELSYVDKEKPEFRRDFKSIIEQRFPFSNVSS